MLALTVVVSHLLPLPAIGQIAVFGFYTLSGYLITAILYGPYRGRIGAYLINRSLRIYPLYWAVALIGLAAAAWGKLINPAIVMPSSIDEIWRQFTIFGLLQVNQHAFPVRLVPPAWSLNVELVYYLLLIPLSWRPGIAIVPFAAIAIWVSVAGDHRAAYWTFYGPGFCFLLGSLLQRGKPRLPPLSAWHVIFGAAIFLGLLFVASHRLQQPWVLYTASLCTAYLITAADFQPHGKWAVEADRWLGRLSYPVFLAHWPVASLLMLPQSPLLLAFTLPIVLAVSWALVRFIEMPVERVRSRIRAVTIAPGSAPSLPDRAVPNSKAATNQA